MSEIDAILSVEEVETEPTETEETEPVETEGQNDTSEETEEDESEEGSEGEEGKENQEEPPEPKRNKVQERIDKITREKYEWQRKAQEYEARLKSNEPELPEKPDPRQFRNERDYRDAHIRWQTEMKYAEKQIQDSEEQRVQSTLNNVANKIQTEKGKFKDFDTVVSSIQHVKMDDALTDVILNDPNGVEILYQLGKNPAAADELSLLSPIQQARKLGQLSVRIDHSKKGKQVSGAPKPPSKVKGGAKKERDPGEMSGEEYAVWRRKQK